MTDTILYCHPQCRFYQTKTPQIDFSFYLNVFPPLHYSSKFRCITYNGRGGWCSFLLLGYVAMVTTHTSSIRVKKLRETLVAVQQLEKKMSSLRSWLSHIEMELSRPIVYDTCEEKEIEKKLNQQQVNGTTHKTVRGST